MGRHLLRRKDVILIAVISWTASLFAQVTQSAPLAGSAAHKEPETAVSAQAIDSSQFPEAVQAEENPVLQRPPRIPFDIPVPDSGYAQTMIDKYRSEFLTKFGHEWLAKTLDDGETYRLYVRRELAKRGMPASLEYLPVVESNYNPHAQSKSGAAGLWQFMTNSMSPMLCKNEWIDERYDPWKSTDAALTKLQDNYRMFKDWPLAIAAYNCGAGAMNRILKKSPVKTFWYIAEHNLLRDQSVQYVPKFLAISDLVSNGPYYDILLPEISKTTRFAEFDSLDTTSSVTLSRLASELRLDEKTLRTLNPALIRGCTPPAAPYALRLPSGMQEAARTALAQIESPGEEKTKTTLHKVAKGETLWSISRIAGCTVDELCSFNGIQKDSILSVGSFLYVPVPTKK
jgi:membrane-bound lytic murein transglycosylase D